MYDQHNLLVVTNDHKCRESNYKTLELIGFPSRYLNYSFYLILQKIYEAKMNMRIINFMVQAFSVIFFEGDLHMGGEAYILIYSQ